METERNAPIMLKPLEGFPMMSDNCWNAILGALRGRLASEGETCVLEWGAGNSTISLAKECLVSGKRANVTSVEHETDFFPWLAEAVMAEFSRNPSGPAARVSWHPLRPPVIPLSRVGKVISERRSLACPSLKWMFISGNKRLQYIEGSRPDFRFRPITWLKQLSKLLLVELGYWSWFMRGVARSFIVASGETYGLGAPTYESDGVPAKGDFPNRFAMRPSAGCLKISRGDVSVDLWHLPALKTFFWRKHLLADGPVSQLPDFIGVPLAGKFDLIFIDGRARVSCIKRVHRDTLLKDGGWLFVHDAFRFEMMEAFQLFGASFAFLHGSNKTLSGEERCGPGVGAPLIRAGASLDTLESRIDQELFVYQKKT